MNEAYDHPVDVEFTANFMENGTSRINLLQCRPLQFQGTDLARLPSIQVAEERFILKAHGAVVGQSRFGALDTLVYVSPKHYAQLSLQERYQVARWLGQINRVLSEKMEMSC